MYNVCRPTRRICNEIDKKMNGRFRYLNKDFIPPSS